MLVAGSFIRVIDKDSVNFFITEDSHMTWDPTENNIIAIFC